MLMSLRNIILTAPRALRAPNPPTPLGRWMLDGDALLRAEYATRDSCGSDLCKDEAYHRAVTLHRARDASLVDLGARPAPRRGAGAGSRDKKAGAQ